MPLPMPTSKSHLTVPSAERCSERIAGGFTSAMPFSFSRSDFARSVIASKSATPRWWIHWNTCFARNGFSPCSANQSVSPDSVKLRRFVFWVMCRLWPAACCLPGEDLRSREEVRDFGRRGFGRVAAVHGVGVDRLREVGADRAPAGFLRLRRGDGARVRADRTRAVGELDSYRAGEQEIQEGV